MDPQQKEYARQSVLTVLEIRRHEISSLFAGSREHLIVTMKAAALDGFQIASYATVGLAVLCAIAVALLLPWRRPTEGSVLLGWMQSETTGEDPKTSDTVPSSADEPVSGRAVDASGTQHRIE